MRITEKGFISKNFGKIIFFPWILVYLLLIILKIALLTVNIIKSKRPRNLSSTLIIEAGLMGWESIEFQELQQSAIEYLSEEQVVRLEINKDYKYLKQVLDAVRLRKPSHYLYDPRTGSQNLLIGFFQASFLAHYFLLNGITPIALLTDLSIRRWRLLSAVITAINGVTLTFMHPKIVHSIFPHKRLIGPLLMPFSNKLLNKIDLLRIEQSFRDRDSKAIFTGSLYEPRHSYLKEIQRLLQGTSGNFEILGRPIGSPRLDSQAYWERMINHKIVITTASQVNQPGTDMTWVPHLLYRYLEALSCGALLIAPSVPGIERYFVPGIHFVSFESEIEAAEKIIFYQNNISLGEEISSEGNKKANNLIRSNYFWLSVDLGLGKHSLI